MLCEVGNDRFVFLMRVLSPTDLHIIVFNNNCDVELAREVLRRGDIKVSEDGRRLGPRRQTCACLPDLRYNSWLACGGGRGARVRRWPWRSHKRAFKKLYVAKKWNAPSETQISDGEPNVC